MVTIPVSRNIDAPADPFVIMLLHVIDEALQRSEPAGPTDYSVM
jgi:hypothetical protein